MPDWPRKHIDLERYKHEVRSRPCFICELRDGTAERTHDVVYADERYLVFLNRFPTLYGYVLLAPKEHRTEVTADFTTDEYVEMQALLHRVAEAVRTETGAERIYLMSLGSKQGNSHVHWHIAPLPAGVPYDEQQFEALRAENGVLDIPSDEQEAYAERLRERLES